jgi:AbrB family looped-hinge helix DNA binding protein
MKKPRAKSAEPPGFPRFYGKVPVGTKGQIVIPAEARKAINIKPKDKVIIISGPPHHNKMISIIPEEEFNKFLRFFEDQVTNLKKLSRHKA